MAFAAGQSLSVHHRSDSHYPFILPMLRASFIRLRLIPDQLAHFGRQFSCAFPLAFYHP